MTKRILLAEVAKEGQEAEEIWGAESRLVKL